MLTTYQTRTQQLLQNPGAPTSLYSTADITSYINTARGQLAGEVECIRVLGTLPTVVGQPVYDFSAINIGVSGTTGVSGVMNVRQMGYAVGTGKQWVASRNWEWYFQYHLNNPVPSSGPPSVW